MLQDSIKAITRQILNLQDGNGCWNVLHPGDKYYPAFNYYAPNYKSTLWTLVFLADIQCDAGKGKLVKPLKTMAKRFLDKKVNIYTLGKSHFPIPCLNGNMLYLHGYFGWDQAPAVEGVIDFFARYQRFDDGDFQTPASFPYCSNRSCYGKHTCYWGVVKLLKGLSFIPRARRSARARQLMRRCVDFILLHKVCFSSRNGSHYLHTNIKKLTFPNMYQADFLEILWLLKREKVKSPRVGTAIELLESKMKPDSTWKIERRIKNLVIPMGNRNKANSFLTGRAREVLDYYR